MHFIISPHKKTQSFYWRTRKFHSSIELAKVRFCKNRFRPSLFFSKLSARHNLAILECLGAQRNLRLQLPMSNYNVKTYDIVCSSPEAVNFWWEYFCRIDEFGQGGGDKEEKSDRCWWHSLNVVIGFGVSFNVV